MTEKIILRTAHRYPNLSCHELGFKILSNIFSYANNPSSRLPQGFTPFLAEYRNVKLQEASVLYGIYPKNLSETNRVKKTIGERFVNFIKKNGFADCSFCSKN